MVAINLYARSFLVFFFITGGSAPPGPQLTGQGQGYLCSSAGAVVFPCGGVSSKQPLLWGVVLSIQ